MHPVGIAPPQSGRLIYLAEGECVGVSRSGVVNWVQTKHSSVETEAIDAAWVDQDLVLYIWASTLELDTHPFDFRNL